MPALALVPERPTPSPRPRHVLAALFETRRAGVGLYLRQRFPRVCISQIDDAVSDAFVDLLRQPHDVERAWQTGGEARLEGLVRVVAWRKLRGARRRAHVRCELPVDDLATVGRSNAAGQVLGVALLHLDAAIERALPAANTKASHLPAVRAALLDKLETHDSDGTVAARHGVRREHLNRAKRALMTELAGLT